MKTSTDASGTRTIDYAADGQMLAEQLAFNTSLFTLHEKCDDLGRNTGYALSNEVALITGTMQSFDQYGRLNTVAVDGLTGAFTYGYLEGSHLQKTLAMPNGVTRTFGYEPNRDLLTRIVHSNATERLVQRDFTYDGLGRLENRTLFRANETPVQPDAFGYNLRSELTNAVIGANAFAYAFDPIGNRLAATEFGTNTAYTASALNQYASIQSVSSAQSADTFLPEFDLDGNQTLLRTTTGIWHVWYNSENRPILFSNDTTVVEMAYDFMGRRFEYKETVSGTLTRHERHLYRGYLQIAALDMLSSGSVKHFIVWDPAESTATRPLALQVGVNSYFYSFDQIKNVTELFDSAGALAATYDYSPFGQVTSFQMTQSGNNALTQFSNPLSFSSEINDSTLGLQYYNYRHLNLLDGRWVNRDPMGIIGGLNIYGMVDNCLSSIYDVLGLSDDEKKCPCTQEDIDAEGIKRTNEAIKLTEDPKNYIEVEYKKVPNEYAGRICCKLGFPKGKVYSTEPTPGRYTLETVEEKGRKMDVWRATSALSLAPNCEAGDPEVGIYHTHPDGSGFSKADMLNKCIYLRKPGDLSRRWCWRHLNGQICAWNWSKKEWICTKEF
jgi:RHS repeat-associated protein